MKFMTHSKKGHKRTRLGLLSAYAGLLVFFACPLATSTLAWFSIGSYTRVRDLTFSYKGAELSARLKISGSSGYILPDEQNRFRFSDEFSFSPVSGMFQDSWYSPSLDPEKDYPSLCQGYSDFDDCVRETPAAERNNHFVSLEFYFTSTSGVYLFLDSSTLLSADREANLKAVSGDIEEAARLDKIESACRLSFFSNMGYCVYEPNVEESSGTYYGGRLNVRPADGYWDADENGREILYGEYSDQALEELEYSPSGPSEPKNPFLTLDGSSKEGNLAITEESLAKVEQEGLIAKEKSYTLSELLPNASMKRPLLYVPSNSTRRLVVSLYLEGWDEDCELSLASATLAASISFTGVYAPKGTSGFPLPQLGKDVQN